MRRVVGLVVFGLFMLGAAQEGAAAKGMESRMVATRSLEGHTGLVWSVQFSPDGKMLASGGSDRVIRIWDVATWKAVQTMDRAAGSVMSLSWSSDSKKLAAGERGGVVQVFDVGTGKVEVQMPAHGKGIYVLHFLPKDQRVAVAGEDGFLRVWEIATRKQVMSADVGDTIIGMGVDPAGKLAVVSTNVGIARIYNLDTGAVEAEIPGKSNQGFAAFFAENGRLAVVHQFQHTLVYDVLQKKIVGDYSQPAVAVRAALAQGPVAAAIGGRSIRLWNPTTGEVTTFLRGAGSSLWGLDLSPDGRYVAAAGGTDKNEYPLTQDAADDPRIYIWDLKQELKASAPVIELKLDSRPQKGSMSVTRDGRLGVVVSHVRGAARELKASVVDLKTGQTVRSIPTAAAQMTTALSTDGQLVACAGAGTISVAEVGNGSVVRKIEHESIGPGMMAFSPDKKMLAVAQVRPREDGTVVVLDAGSGAVKRTLAGKGAAIAGMAWSPDSKRLFAWSRAKEGKAGAELGGQLWDVATGKEVKTFPLAGRCFLGAWFSEDGASLWLADAKGYVKQYDVGTLEVKRLWHAGVVGGPDFTHAAFWPQGEKMAFVPEERDAISVLDLKTSQVSKIPGSGAWEMVLFFRDGALHFWGYNDAAGKIWSSNPMEAGKR